MAFDIKQWHDLVHRDNITREGIALEVDSQSKWIEASEDALANGDKMVLESGARIAASGATVILRHRKEYVTKLIELLTLKD